MEQKIILLALVAGMLFLTGCIQVPTTGPKEMCKKTGGTDVKVYGFCEQGQECPWEWDCLCQEGKLFDSVKGCVAKSAKQLCELSGGRYGNWPCKPCLQGEPCPPCGEGCFCGNGTQFDSELGCIAQNAPQIPQELQACKSLCETSGGTFTYCAEGDQCFVGTGCGCAGNWMNCEQLASQNGCAGN